MAILHWDYSFPDKERLLCRVYDGHLYADKTRQGDWVVPFIACKRELGGQVPERMVGFRCIDPEEMKIALETAYIADATNTSS